MATFDRQLKKILDFGHLEKPVKQHLKSVYASLSVSLLVATAGAYVHLFTSFIQAGLLTAIASIGLLIWLSATPHNPGNHGKRFGILMGFSFLSGLSLGPLLDVCIRINPSIIPTALLGTAVIFICFSMSALLSNDRKFIFFGGALFSGMSWLLILGFLNIFFRSTLLFQVELYLGLAIMCGLVLYDTQLIVEKRRRGDDDYIWHCVDLFIDIMGIFRRLLIILSQKEERRDRRK